MASSRVIVYGAGGHSKVVAELLRVLGFDLAGFVEDSDDRDGARWLGAAIVSASQFEADRGRWGGLPAALAVGDNAGRAGSAAWLRRLGHPILALIHPSAVVARGVAPGDGTVVMPGAVVNPAATLGAGVIVNTSAVVEHDAAVGDFAHISPRAALGGGALVGDCAHVGLGAVVLPRVVVGARAVVGAGAVVLNDVPDDAVVAGVPARPIRRRPAPSPGPEEA